MYSQNDFRNYQELYHHGILGQKWGVRRFQNSDGSLTPAGRERYGYGEAKTLTKEEKKAKKQEESRRKAEEKFKKKQSEDYSNKSELLLLAAMIPLDILSLNPIGLSEDVIRLGQAAVSAVRTNKFNKERSLSEVDEKTGFKLKQTEMTQKEDLVRVNPSVYNFDSNTKSNCMLCTTTYDMRRRGYDVTAKTAGEGFYPQDIKKWYPKAELKTITPDPGIKPLDIYSGKAGKQSCEKFVNEVSKLPNGARGNICVTWKGTYGGHSMIWEVNDGQVQILDGQVNKIYKKPESILKQTNGTFTYARLDNVKFDKSEIKRCCKS